MPKTVAEAREYQRGYNRGVARGRDRVERVLHIARRYQDKPGSNVLQTCRHCDRWALGGVRCQWGYCRADFEWGLEARMWVDVDLPSDVLKNTKIAIITQPDFGCVSWIPREANTGSVT